MQDNTFKDVFYLIEVSEDFYQLNLTSTHYTLSCGKLSSILPVVERYVRTYKTKDNFLRACHNTLIDKGELSDVQFQHRKEFYKANFNQSLQQELHNVIITTLESLPTTTKPTLKPKLKSALSPKPKTLGTVSSKPKVEKPLNVSKFKVKKIRTVKLKTV